MEYETFKEYIDAQIKEGYLSEKDLAPLKCYHCGSTDLEDKYHSYENLGIVSYDRYCKSCGKIAGTWSYGAWDS